MDGGADGRAKRIRFVMCDADASRILYALTRALSESHMPSTRVQRNAHRTHNIRILVLPFHFSAVYYSSFISAVCAISIQDDSKKEIKTAAYQNIK